MKFEAFSDYLTNYQVGSGAEESQLVWPLAVTIVVILNLVVWVPVVSLAIYLFG